MSIGSIFLVIAMVLFFLAAVPQAVLSGAVAIPLGLFFLTLGILTGGVSLPWGRAP
jgi:hypothetical protein